MQQSFLKGAPISNSLYRYLNVKLENSMNSCDKLELSEITSALMQTLKTSDHKKLKDDLSTFSKEIYQKWNITKKNNMKDNVFGINDLFHRCATFDSFQKDNSKTDFNEYKKLFQLKIPDCDPKPLKEEFQHYLLEELPETDNFDIIKYWCSLSLSYPLLSKITLTRLCIACGSLDAA
jgi:hypothetical protein